MFYTLPFYHLAFTYLYEDNKILLSIILELSKCQFEPKVSKQETDTFTKHNRNSVKGQTIQQSRLNKCSQKFTTTD